jgi:hypothetical protein
MKRQIISFTLVCTLVFGSTATSAYATSPLYAFGGRLTTVFYCTCMNAYLLTITGPKPGMFIYYPGVTTLYMYFMALIPGVQQIGTASMTPVPGMVYAGTGCAPSGAGMPIIMMGTSLPSK